MLNSTNLRNTKKIKTAAIYDRWLHSLGGGEQVAFAYAVALNDLGYKTDLLTHKKIDIQTVQQKMNIDLKKIQVKYIPNLADFQLSQYTEKYDIFVSNSYLDYIPNRSKFGILSIFFPSKINISLYEYLKRAYIVPSLRKFFVYPSRFEGFRYDDSMNGVIYKWLGKESTITFNQNIKEIKIELFFDYLAFSCLDSITFSIGTKPIKFIKRKVNIYNNTVRYEFHFNVPTKGSGLIIYLPEGEFSEGVSLTKIIIPNYRYAFYNIFKRLLPRFEMRLHGGPSITKYSDVESYDKILTISTFSQKWIDKYWGLPSNILYPPVSTQNFKPAKIKKNIIVNIGRFFVTGHCKKQLDMVRVFKKLIDKGYRNWELHFVGSIAESEIHQKYFETCKEEAASYPVFFHNNAPFSELKTILSLAKIYWHATGLDEDPEKNPIRLEHFGITTVEAMASGCVPVVIDLGGQEEIVTDECGFRWRTREELLRYTIKLIKNRWLLKKMSLRAIERSKFFSIENFKKQLEKYLPPITSLGSK